MTIAFEASYFDGKSAKLYSVNVTEDPDGLRIEGEDGLSLCFALEQCLFEPALGSSPRVIRLPDDARLETWDLATVAEIEKREKKNRAMRGVGVLEGHWHWVLISVAVLAALTFFFITEGVPRIAEKVAGAISPSVLESVSVKTLEELDSAFFKPSELSENKRDSLRVGFRKLVDDLGFGGVNYRLELRKGGRLGPNAFALPSGIVLLTDELVAKSTKQREVMGVLAHEIHHVKLRHGMRGLIQNAGLLLILSLVLGDVSSITSMGASLPAFLVRMGYSREFEREADRRAGLYMIEKGWGVEPYCALLDSITKGHSGPSALSWISSHPDTKERIKEMRELDEQR